MSVGLLAAACSTSAASEEPAPTTVPSTTHSHEMDMTSMGDPDAAPATSISGADVSSGQFEPLSVDTSVSGTADLARHADGTTVTVMLTGLEPGADYIAHVHAEACAAGGGPHYQFDVGGDHHPPNEIHLAFTSDGDGMGHMTVNNAAVADGRAVSVVVHRSVEGAPKLACADLN